MCIICSTAATRRRALALGSQCALCHYNVSPGFDATPSAQTLLALIISVCETVAFSVAPVHYRLKSFLNVIIFMQMYFQSSDFLKNFTWLSHNVVTLLEIYSYENVINIGRKVDFHSWTLEVK